MKKTLSTLIAVLAMGLCGVGQLSGPMSAQAPLVNAGSFGQGDYYAAAYNYNTTVFSGGSTAGGTYAVQVFKPFVTLPGNRQVAIFSVTAPITIGSGSSKETVTPTSVSSGCGNFNVGTGAGQSSAACSITAVFANAHGQGDQIVSGSAGLQEAINDAFSHGGGEVIVDPVWINGGGTSALINAALPYAGVSIVDYSKQSPTWWNITPSTASFLAVPTTLTAVTALPSATPAGSYGTGTYHLCVAYVDVMGNEGACSLDFSEAGLASGSFIFTAPAASTGAVGYTIYISLTSGTYALAYQVPITSAVCKMTAIETVTPACAVANTTYGQSAANATVTAITTNTAPLALQLGAASTTADYVGNSNGRTGYAYVPGSHAGLYGIVQSSLAFTAGPATVATTVPQVIGTIAIPPSFMNLVGTTIRLCGKLQMTNASATVEQIQLWWDGAGSNAAGVPVEIANIQVGGTGTAVAYNGNFCWTGHTTVAGAGATAGSIQGDNSFYDLAIASAPVGSFTPGQDTFTAATGSLNLAGLYSAGFTTRLHIVQLHSTGTDVSPKLVNCTLEVLN